MGDRNQQGEKIVKGVRREQKEKGVEVRAWGRRLLGSIGKDRGKGVKGRRAGTRERERRGKAGTDGVFRQRGREGKQQERSRRGKRKGAAMSTGKGERGRVRAAHQTRVSGGNPERAVAGT